MLKIPGAFVDNIRGAVAGGSRHPQKEISDRSRHRQVTFQCLHVPQPTRIAERRIVTVRRAGDMRVSSAGFKAVELM
jgi:hypothetical protein